MTGTRLTALVLLTNAGLAVAEPVPVQTVGLTDVQVRSDQPVVLVIPPDHVEALRTALEALTKSDVAAPATPQTTASFHVLWEAPGEKVRTLSIRESTISLPVTPHTSGEYRYHLEMRDGSDRFSVRLPGGDRRYRIGVTAESGPVIVSGPGNQDAVYGERVPLAITIAEPTLVRSVVLSHRTRGAAEWTSAAMELTTKEERKGVWTIMVPRPIGSKVTIEYHILVHDTAGRAAHYGGPDKPYRLRIRAPTAPVDVGQ